MYYLCHTSAASLKYGSQTETHIFLNDTEPLKLCLRKVKILPRYFAALYFPNYLIYLENELVIPISSTGRNIH